MRLRDTSTYILEICCPSLQSAIVAADNGADRIELCQNLEQGGTTPSYATIKFAVEKLSIPVHVLIRPRAGPFCYSDLEFELMLEEVKVCRELGCAGVVVGVTDAKDEIDVERTRELVKAAKPMSVTFHRAFDDCIDLRKALGDVIDAGCERLLTSGGETSALAGVDQLARLVEQANGKISIMPGAGILPSNVEQLIRQTGVKEVHASAKTVQRCLSSIRRRGLFDADEISTNPEAVHELGLACRNIG